VVYVARGGTSNATRRRETSTSTLYGAVNAIESNTLRVLVMQDFDGVAVEDGDDGAREVGESRLCPEGKGHPGGKDQKE
jgi:hypothetical protein